MLQAMVGIGVLCALLIVLTYEGTLPAIERNKAAALEQAVFKVLPGISEKVSYQLNEKGAFVPLGVEKADGPVFHAGYQDNGALVGIAIEASGLGFADVLRILYGYDPVAEKVVGFYVLESKETPGLGDKIEKDAAFLENFKALDVALAESGGTLKNEVIPVKHGTKAQAWQVDGITGATISSRAIGQIMGASTAEWVPKLHAEQAVFKQKN
jgi:electron transport complex protein RnfG